MFSEFAKECARIRNGSRSQRSDADRKRRTTTVIRQTGAWLVLILLWLGWGTPALIGATTPAEEIAFKAAERSFQDGFFPRAEKEFGDFVKQYPNSEHLADVILLQAQARFKLARYDSAIDLLKGSMSGAGKAADKYCFWIGEALFQKGDYMGAAAMYAQLLKDYPDSFLRSNASYGEAMSWFKLGNIANTLDRLQSTNGAYQKLAQVQTNDESVIRGYLLLGEALLLQRQYPQAEETLSRLANRSLPPQLDWQRQYLLVRVQLADNRSGTALKDLTNLLSLATATGSAMSQAKTVLLQGQVLRAAGMPEAAVQVYATNLNTLSGAPRRQALMQWVELDLAMTNSAEAIKGLETIIGQYPGDNDIDQVQLALGELRLKQYYELKHGASSTNSQETLAASVPLLQQAQTNFDQIILSFTNSPLLGRAYLDRGWCHWEAGKMAESAAAFKEATARLPLSTNQALARFKWADAQFQLKDYTNACANYRFILDHYASIPGLPASLLEQALYQIVRVSVARADLAGAVEAGDRVLKQFPQGEYGDRSLLLIGQLLNHLGKNQEARQKLDDLLKRFPNSPLIPEVKLAVARTYVQESNWTDAIKQYDDWVAHFTNDCSLPQAEFDRAWVYEQAGRDADAVRFYTNFVARFPNSPLAPLAQNATGNYFFNQGNYVEAERAYQLLYRNTNWSSGELAYQARLAAGRSAFSRQGFAEAADYFTSLINSLIKDTNSSPELLSQAYLAYGDTLVAMTPSGDVTNSVRKFSEAINAFSRIPETDRLAPRAWGRIADCHLQLAAQDSSRYLQASNFYQKVFSAPLADIAARSQAEVGLAEVLKKQAATRSPAEQTTLLNLALDHYLNVVLEKNLRPGEQPSPFWLAKAGQDAAQMLENQARWPEVVNLYQRLLSVLPSQQAGLEKKLDQAKRKL